MTEYQLFHEIVEDNGKTIRENNMEQTHKYPIGTLVEFKTEEWHSDGACEIIHGRWWVVAQTRDCDGTPLYSLSPMRPECVSGEKKMRQMLYWPDSNIGPDDYSLPGGLTGVMMNEEFTRKIVDRWRTGFAEESLTPIEVTEDLKAGHGSLKWPKEKEDE